MSGHKTHPLDVALEGKAEEVRRNLQAQLLEHSRRLELVSLGEVSLPDTKIVKVAHQLGRFPKIVIVSPPRGASTAGLLEEVRDGVDRSKFVGLRASGFGATVKVDLGVV